MNDSPVDCQNVSVTESKRDPRRPVCAEFVRDAREVVPYRSSNRRIFKSASGFEMLLACRRLASGRRSARQQRTSILRPWAQNCPEELPQPTQKARITRAFCVGWGSWIRTSENARVKVWCLTAWLYPNYLIDLWYYITFYSICQELFFFFSYFFCFCLFFPNLQKIMYLFWIILLLFY